VGASDPIFTPEKIGEFINITKKKLNEAGGGEVGLNFESALEEDYKLFVEAGLHFMVLWQETYHPETYKKMHPANTKKADMDFRLDAFDRAIEGGLKRIGIAFLGRLYDWRFEILALFVHGKYLENTYGIPPFIIGTPRWRYAEGCAITKEPYEYPDEAWLLAAAIYKLAFPNSLPWFSTRERFELSAEAAKGGGALFILDCSTAVGGYTLRKDFPQFPVYSKNLSEGIKWLESLGYKPELHLPY
jgi:2-iminoacetate synthase